MTTLSNIENGVLPPNRFLKESAEKTPILSAVAAKREAAGKLGAVVKVVIQQLMSDDGDEGGDTEISGDGDGGGDLILSMMRVVTLHQVVTTMEVATPH